ncbi:MAG TPA: glycerol-3-phosphate 1-O-acyltransferase PlsY [Candidatus Polarisedimenticolia bacterium]|nr:glycerol-3-phosphate 1-O-acyltransferase PlsY [Candidatus Polarisedimenticolia bacterium]
MTASPATLGAILLAAYLLGSIPFGLLLGKALGVDVRRSGSGNIGATNVARSLGPGAGIATLMLDASKGALAAWAGRCLLGPEGAAVAGCAATLGHVFPLYLAFRGGKGVATGLGAFLIVDPYAALAAAGAFLLVIALTRRVSAGSLAGSLALPIALFLRDSPAAAQIAGWVCALLVILRHRDNMTRLLTGTEPRIGERRG